MASLDFRWSEVRGGLSPHHPITSWLSHSQISPYLQSPTCPSPALTRANPGPCGAGLRDAPLVLQVHLPSASLNQTPVWHFLRPKQRGISPEHPHDTGGPLSLCLRPQQFIEHNAVSVTPAAPRLCTRQPFIRRLCTAELTELGTTTFHLVNKAGIIPGSLFLQTAGPHQAVLLPAVKAAKGKPG